MPLCHLSVTDIKKKKKFATIDFFCKNKACVNCGTLKLHNQNLVTHSSVYKRRLHNRIELSMLLYIQMFNTEYMPLANKTYVQTFAAKTVCKC